MIKKHSIIINLEAENWGKEQRIYFVVVTSGNCIPVKKKKRWTEIIFQWEICAILNTLLRGSPSVKGGIKGALYGVFVRVCVHAPALSVWCLPLECYVTHGIFRPDRLK